MTEPQLDGWSVSSRFVFRFYPGECVGFDARTGATHLLAGAAGCIVKRLCGDEGSQSLADSATADPTPSLEQYQAALRELEQLQIIRRGDQQPS